MTGAHHPPAAPAERETQIKLEGLVIGYRGAPVLSAPISLAIAKGEFWGIVGPNGAGKSTLVKTILGIIPPVRGGLWKRTGLTFGYVPQRGALDDIFPLTVLDVVLMGRIAPGGPLRRFTSSDRKLAAHYLDRVGMTPFSGRPFRILSGGQKQRVLIARGLTGEPDILFLDEPTDGMDLAGEHGIMALIQGLQRDAALTIVMVTHMLNLVANFAGKLILVHRRDGRFEAGETRDLLTTEHLQRIYPVQIGVHRKEGATFLFVKTSAGAPQGGASSPS